MRDSRPSDASHARATIDARARVEELFALHSTEINTYLARMVRDPELAADLTQDTFVRAFRALDTLEDQDRARPWLYRIANHAALDELRRRRIVRFIPWTGESRGTAPSAERLAMDTRLSGPLERALSRIPERQRAALLLAELHELSGVELAEILGVSHVAARALLSRARESLRLALVEEEAGSEPTAVASEVAPEPRVVRVPGATEEQGRRGS
jgi:RNA polymerase sigma factor (sigma-70 family)